MIRLRRDAPLPTAPWVTARRRGTGPDTQGCVALHVCEPSFPAPPPASSLPPGRRCRARVASGQYRPRHPGKLQRVPRALQVAGRPAGQDGHLGGVWLRISFGSAPGKLRPSLRLCTAGVGALRGPPWPQAQPLVCESSEGQPRFGSGCARSGPPRGGLTYLRPLREFACPLPLRPPPGAEPRAGRGGGLRHAIAGTGPTDLERGFVRALVAPSGGTPWGRDGGRSARFPTPPAAFSSFVPQFG